MDMIQVVKDYKRNNEIGEISICDMDRSNYLLVDARGCVYHEVETNVWADASGNRDDVMYLGTGKHGAGIILRPLFLKIDKVWLNATTGRKAPFCMP